MKKALKESCQSCSPQYPDHSPELKRLNRIIGQLSGIQKMIEERRYCPEILQQIKAANAALKGLETVILEKHIRSCITETMQSKKGHDIEVKISELMNLLR